jgi:hypothetical protein
MNRNSLLTDTAARLCVGLSLLAASVAPSCVAAAAAAAGAAGAVYVQGDLEATLEGSPEDVERATRAGLEGLSMPVLSSNATSLDGSVRSETATGKPVHIELRARDDGLTEVSIRIGTFGDESASTRILDAIREQLG